MARDVVSYTAQQSISFVLPTYLSQLYGWGNLQFYSYAPGLNVAIRNLCLHSPWSFQLGVWFFKPVFVLHCWCRLVRGYSSKIGTPQMSQFFVETTGQNIWNRDCLRKGLCVPKKMQVYLHRSKEMTECPGPCVLSLQEYPAHLSLKGAGRL